MWNQILKFFIDISDLKKIKNNTHYLQSTLQCLKKIYCLNQLLLTKYCTALADFLCSTQYLKMCLHIYICLSKRKKSHKSYLSQMLSVVEILHFLHTRICALAHLYITCNFYFTFQRCKSQSDFSWPWSFPHFQFCVLRSIEFMRSLTKERNIEASLK